MGNEPGDSAQVRFSGWWPFAYFRHWLTESVSEYFNEKGNERRKSSGPADYFELPLLQVVDLVFDPL
jgi:hypothetical protein